MRNECIEFTVYTERVYKTFLDLIKCTLDEITADDINSIQAFILLNIDENSVTMSEIVTRGYYVGSNASYNIRRLLSNGYIEQSTSAYDKRVSYVTLTNKGKLLIGQLNNKLSKFNKKINANFKELSNFLSQIENYWRDILNKNPI